MSEKPQQDPRAEMRRISRRSFLWAGAALIGTYGGFRFLASRHTIDGLPWPFRRVLGLNEDLWSDEFSKAAMAPTFTPTERTTPRVNGDEGMKEEDDFEPADWKLSVENVYGKDDAVKLSIEDIRKLPRHEFTTQLCCIEGWSMIVTWAGCRFSDFAANYLSGYRSDAPNLSGPPDVNRANELVRYVYMETPDEGYYVGLDMQSMLHPQTLLCYEMNGQPLTLEHGAPLRLVIPVKYGIKNIKRIGLIRYTDEKPKDFWAEQGYDWYAGL